MDALVQIDDVTKRYGGSGRHVADGTTLELARCAITVQSALAKTTSSDPNADTVALPEMDENVRRDPHRTNPTDARPVIDVAYRS